MPDAPKAFDQVPLANPSNCCESVLNRICPAVPAGRSKNVPFGKSAAPVPGRVGSFAIAIVGFPGPPELVTLIWLVAPTISTEVTPPAVKATRPLEPLRFCKDKTRPESEMVGFPETPNPLVTEMPAEPLTSSLGTMLPATLNIKPLPAFCRLRAVPVSSIDSVDSAPPSTSVMPLLPAKDRLLGSVGS